MASVIEGFSGGQRDMSWTTKSSLGSCRHVYAKVSNGCGMLAFCCKNWRGVTCGVTNGVPSGVSFDFLGVNMAWIMT